MVAVSTEGLTLDRFLGGRVIAAQPADGFRAGHDTVLLAAAVPAGGASVALELGSGAGVASLCLAARVGGVRITGLEIDPELVRLANENAARNGVSDRVSFVTADVSVSEGVNLRATSPHVGRACPRLDRGSNRGSASARSGSGGGEPVWVDHVFFNPPFHPTSSHTSPSAARDMATRDTEGAVVRWTKTALDLTRDGGTVTAIVRADRLDDVLSAARLYGGVVFPLLPRAGAKPKRAIVRIVKTNGTFRLGAGLILHEADGKNTEAAENVLRHAQALDLAP